MGCRVLEMCKELVYQRWNICASESWLTMWWSMSTWSNPPALHATTLGQCGGSDPSLVIIVIIGIWSLRKERWSVAFEKLWKMVWFWSCRDENAEDVAEMAAERRPRWPNALMTRGNPRVIHLFGKWWTEVHDVHAKKTCAAQATWGVGMGGA